MSTPDNIQTEFGRATIGVVRPINAVKQYLCPLCDEEIAILEQHLIVVPEVKSRLRRHCHTECVETHVEHNLTVKLHPKEPDAASYYF